MLELESIKKEKLENVDIITFVLGDEIGAWILVMIIGAKVEVSKESWTSPPIIVQE